MARSVGRIWLRFALAIAGAVGLTLAVQVGVSMLYQRVKHAQFLYSLPETVRDELDALESAGHANDPRVGEIYSEFWRGDPWESDLAAILAGLLTCLPVGLLTGLWVSRVVTQPVATVAETAGRVALGDFSVRASVGRERGELASLLKDFNLMVDSLETLERERQYTAAAISHELRTPLAVLQARLHGICDGVIPADGKEFGRLLAQVQHLGYLVGDLHTLSVADAGRLRLNIEPVDVAALVRETVADYTARLQAEAMACMVDAPQKGVIVAADIHRLRQILDNLIENALRYACAGGWLGISVRSDGAIVTLAVSDAGPGVRPEMTQRIFQRFYREETARHRAKGGTGLGLAVVNSLVKAHGGSISVQRSVRDGAQFVIRLPVKSKKALS